MVREHVDRPTTAVDAQLDPDPVRHDAAARRSIAAATPRSPRTRSIASRYSGLARIDVGDGLASAKSRVEQRGLVGVGRARVREQPARVREEHGPRPDAAVRDPRHAVGRDGARERHRRQVVAAPPRPPQVHGPARPVRHRQLDRLDELVRRERRDPGPDEEVGERDPPPPTRAHRDDLRAVDEQRRRRVRGRRRVADIARQRRPVPDLRRPDVERRLGEGRVVAPHDASSAAMSVIVVSAPNRTRPSTRSIRPSSSAIRLTSTTTCGRNVPSRNRMMRSVPPARSRAPPSGWAASNPNASARLAGRA